ncbi:hypothetical protein N7492_000442 [Penicillium capsulatum]|uniref:Uncharacterized protein n=1 Tax=Penicillium capsulatum TaxID=69766 RepID=A0A9W9IST8_9EURO|nr:hypothetical protein N7492_000442 [Penicillium capsulatum]KAJ6130496.1 hypothetical protein N7512_003276 [Penicillium capsulatum]
MLALQVPLALMAGLFLTPYIAAQTTMRAANPGCYSSCRFIDMDFDGERIKELCNETTSLGSLFNGNMENCADCVRTNKALNSTYYTQKDAQDTLRIVNLCQANFPTNHTNIVSAMSVIKQYGSVYGDIATAQATTSATSPATGVSATATPTPTVASPPARDDSTSGNKAWIAGAVIGPVAAVAIVLAGVFFLMRRRKENHMADSSTNGGHVYEKSELPAESRQRVELPSEHAVEAAVRVAPQELDAAVLAELPGHDSRNHNKDS